MGHEVWQNIGWALVFAFVGGVAGIVLIFVAALVLPRIVERFTPKLDEQAEIARGNQAVAEYFGRVVGACILGASIIIAAAILGGVLAALY